MKHLDSGLKMGIIWKFVFLFHFHTEGWFTKGEKKIIYHFFSIALEVRKEYKAIRCIFFPLYIGVGMLNKGIVERKDNGEKLQPE